MATTTTIDMNELTDVIRNIVREEIRTVLRDEIAQQMNTKEVDFQQSVDKIFTKYKKVFDALA